MNNKANTSCAICGKQYYLCSSCQDFKTNSWKLHTDTSEHYKVYQILHGYSIGVYDDMETYIKLQKVDLSDLNTYVDSVKRVILSIKELHEKPIESENDELVQEIQYDKKQKSKKNKQVQTS